MKGSEKQIKWAKDIITNAEKSWDDLKVKVNPDAQGKFDEMKNDFFKRMSSDDASVIISNRMSYPKDADHLHSNFAYFSKVSLVS